MDDMLRSKPGYVLRRASAAMMADLTQRLAPLGLRPAEASMLMLIEANPGITQSMIGRALRIKRANITPLAARLTELGLLATQRVDGRSTALSLSEAGRALVVRAHAATEAHESRLLALVPEEHRAHLLPALEAIWQGAGCEVED